MNIPPKLSGGPPQTVSADEVYQVMTGCISQDPALLKASSDRLKELFNMFGTYDALHEIAAEKAVPLQIRQQAIIQFKNAVQAHWRSRKVLSDDQRIRIRGRCFTFLDEEDDMIAQCNELIVAKISRIDYPNNWPNLVDDLLKVIHSTFQKRFSDPLNEDPQDTLILRRSIKLLNKGVLKEFMSIKMPAGIRTMGAIVAKSQATFCEYYSSLIFTLYLKNPYPDLISPRASTDILLAHLVFKCVSKMAIWLWHRLDFLEKEGLDLAASLNWLSTLVAESFEALKQLVKRRQEILEDHRTKGLASNPFAQKSIDVLTRHIRTLGKFFKRLQELSSFRFSALPCCADLVAYYWGQVVEATDAVTKDPYKIADSTEAFYPVRFLVQGMILFKDSLSQWKPMRKDGAANQNALPSNFVQIAVETLIKQFMPLKEAELNEWTNDPEQWVNDQDTDNEQWVFEIRPCSERVLMALSNAFPDVVAQLLVTLYNNFGTVAAGNLQEVIQKEALYCAIGRCASRLHSFLPFEQWLQTTLAAEAQSTDAVYPIIKRRIAWLLGKLVGESCLSPANPLLWQIFIHLLRDRGLGSDPVVRMTAAITLRECVDSLDFNIDVFAPFLPATISELVKLLGEADTFEIKRRVDYSLNVVIEQSGERISDFVNIITEPLPGLWIEAGEEWLFKISLLVTVTKLVEATKARSVALTGIIVPLVKEGLSPGVVTHLDEDTLNLWLAALRNTTTIHNQGGPALVDLFPQAVSLLATNLDLLGRAVDIINAYLLLDAPALLQTFALELFQAYFAALSSAAVTTNLKDMILSLNLLVQVAPSSLWGEAMHTSGLFSLLLKTIVDGEADALLLTEHILLMSRITMADRQMLLRLMAATATLDMTETKLYDKLLDQWWGTWDSMSEPRHRKLSAMGMAALVSTARRDVLERIPGDIFNMWTDVLLELKEAQVAAAAEDAESENTLKRHWDLDEAGDAYYQSTEGTPEYDRRKTVYERDPVRTVQLTAYIAANLNEARATCGPQAFQDNYLSKADPAVLSMIQDQLSRG